MVSAGQKRCVCTYAKPRFELIGDQRLWGSISNGVCILVVGYFIGQFGINCAFYIFGASVMGFIAIALCTSVVPSAEEVVLPNGEREPLLISQGNNNNKSTKGFYTTDPNTADMMLDLDVPSSNMRRLSSTASSHANTLLLDGDHSLLNLQRTVTSLAARDVYDESSLLLDQMDSLPPLGLALSHIPTVDTSLAAFASIMDEEERHELSVSLKSTIFGSAKVWTFLLMTLLFGVFYSMVAQFLFLFLKQDLELSSSIIGWTGPLGGVTEVSTFYVSRLVSISVVHPCVCVLLKKLCHLAVEKVRYPQPGHLLAFDHHTEKCNLQDTSPRPAKHGLDSTRTAALERYVTPHCEASFPGTTNVLFVIVGF